MALLSQAIREKDYDVRTIERSLSKGLMTHDAVNKNQKTITDDESNSQYINTEELYETVKGKGQLRD